MRHRTFCGASILLVLGGWLLSCDRPKPLTEDEVRASDSLVALIRKQLTDPRPRTVQLEIMCEADRLANLFGQVQMGRLVRAAYDRAYSWKDRGAQRQVEQRLARHGYSIDEYVCDSLSRGLLRHDSEQSEQLH